MKKLVFLSAVVLAAGANTVNAVPYYEFVGMGNVGMLQGGATSTSTFKWYVPSAGKYKVSVFVPGYGTATSALYRIYPKGEGSDCSPSNATFPCYEIIINQAANKAKWLPLTLSKTVTQWTFNKSGSVSVYPTKTAETENIALAQMRFETPFPPTAYSKIANNGNRVEDTAVLGTGATNWACTRDNVTGLIWEVKTDDGGLRDKDNTFSWFDPNPATNGGNAGTYDHGTCTGGISCDTNGYAKAVNTQKLCGYSDWRLPTNSELIALNYPAAYLASESIYFPNTLKVNTWSSSTDPVYNFYAYYSPYGSEYYKYAAYAVRLVRGQ